MLNRHEQNSVRDGSDSRISKIKGRLEIFMPRKTSIVISAFIFSVICICSAAPAFSQDMAGDNLQIGENRSNEFSYSPYLIGAGTVETLATFQKTFSRTTKDYRVGVFNDITLTPDSPLFITGKYLTFGSYNRVSIPAGVEINTNGPSDIYGSYSAARNSGSGDFRGRAVGGRFEAIDNRTDGSTWGVVGAEISAYIEGVLPKYGSVGAAINVVNNATDHEPESNAFLFAISTSVANNGNAHVTEQAVINLKNLGGQGTGIIPNMYGIKINQPSSAYGTKVYNNIGLFVADHSTIGEYLRYNVYSVGTNSKNYFQGEVQVDGQLKLSGQCRGVAQIERGRAVVSSTCVRETSAILVTRRSATRDVITYSYTEIAEGASFTILSSELSDDAQVSWLVIN
jgi:hypothetical protein